MQGALTGCLTRDAPPITLKNRLARLACQPPPMPPPPGILLYKNPLVTVFTSKFHRSARARCPEGRPSRGRNEGRKEQRTIIISLIFLPHREKAATWTKRTRPLRWYNCNHAEGVPSSWQLCHEVQSIFSGGLPVYGPLVKDKRERRIHNLITFYSSFVFRCSRGT